MEMKRDSIWTCSSRRSIGCRQQTRYGWQFRLQSEDVTKTPACAASALIGFGLMAAHLKSKSIEVLAEPRPYRPRPDERWFIATIHPDRLPTSGSRVCRHMLQAGSGRPRDL